MGACITTRALLFQRQNECWHFRTATLINYETNEPCKSGRRKKKPRFAFFSFFIASWWRDGTLTIHYTLRPPSTSFGGPTGGKSAKIPLCLVLLTFLRNYALERNGKKRSFFLIICPKMWEKRVRNYFHNVIALSSPDMCQRFRLPKESQSG